MISRKLTTALALSAALTALPIEPLPAQGLGQASVVRTARIVSSLEYDDNFDLRENSAGDSILWNNTFGYSYRLLAPTEALDADVEATLRFSDIPGRSEQAELDDPTLRLDYVVTRDDSTVRADLFLNRADVAFLNPLDFVGPDGDFDDTEGDGERREFRGGIIADLNQSSPVSLRFVLDGRVVDYIDTTDPELNDLQRYFILGEAGFLVSPILRATLGASYDDQDSDDDNVTKRQITTVDAGFDGELNPRATLRFRIGYSIVETERQRGDDRQEGVVGDLRYLANLQNGSFAIGANSRIDENGTRNTISVDRNLDLRRGTLSASIGLSSNDTTDIRPVGDIVYSSFGRRSRVTARLRQVATVDDESQDVLNTFASLRYDRNLTRLTSLNLAVQAGVQRFENSDQDDTDRFNFTAGIDRTITPDWGIGFGYRYRYRDTSSIDSAQSNAVFVDLRRTFRATR